MTATALVSRADGSDELVDLESGLHGRPRSKALLWVDLSVPTGAEVDQVATALRLDDDTRRALEGDLESPNARMQADAVEVIVDAADTDSLEPRRVQMLAGAGWVVTRHDDEAAFLEEHRQQILDERETGRLHAVELLATMLDWQIETFFAAAESLEREVDRLDEAALRGSTGLLERMVELRSRIGRLRRTVAAQREVFGELTRPDFLPPPAAKQVGDAFERLSVKLEVALTGVTDVREMLIGTFDVHMTRLAQRTNDVMRVLTLASVVLLPSVVIAGIMGMNFKVGLFDNPNLFWVVIALMVALAGATLGFARWRGWL
ncbi:MAG: magnesium transporter CorA family protein [Candidatus Limnocylindria bacterium]